MVSENAFTFVRMTFSFEKCAHKIEMSENAAHFNCFRHGFTKYVIIFTHPQMKIGKNGSIFTFCYTKTSKFGFEKRSHFYARQTSNEI